MVLKSKPWLKPAILADKPLLEVFNRIDKNDYTLILLFATAYYNRVARKSAIAIHKELQLSNTINSQCVRYLLLLYFSTVVIPTKKKDIPTNLLERFDLYKRDKTRLTSMLRLHETGLAIFAKRSNTINTLTITDLGLKAVTIVTSCLNELIHTMPLRQAVTKPKSIKSISLD